MHHPGIRPSTPTALSRGFSLIELLVVISVIAILASILMPTIVLVRRAALTAACASNQRQLVMGFQAYSADYRELPTCYQLTWRRAWNWGDEGCGYINSPRDPNSGQYHPADQNGNPVPPYNESPFSLAWNGEYVTSAMLGCQNRSLPPYGAAWYPWYVGNNYVYNGPGAAANNIGNNSNVSGLFILGGYKFNGATHGWSNLGGNPLSAGQTALIVCPGVWRGGASSDLGEPHGPEAWAPIASQFDWGGGAYDAALYNRNVAYADGHVKHVVCVRAALKDQ